MINTPRKTLAAIYHQMVIFQGFWKVDYFIARVWKNFRILYSNVKLQAMFAENKQKKLQVQITSSIFESY